jgi:regulator of protease activity HflC (stomatin/prohibitin superfamily)
MILMPDEVSRLQDRSEPVREPARPGRALLVLLGAAAFGAAAGTCMYGMRQLDRGADAVPVVTVRGTSSVVRAVRDLANLEAVAFHMERVIDLKQKESHLFGLVQAQDAILLVAAADVVAGIDLSDMREEDVEVNAAERRVRLLLPPPRILYAKLDNERTYVHTRSTDVLAARAEGLEAQARQEAEKSLREAAIEAGILTRARSASARTLESLLRGLEFEHVELTFREE